jgi:hypothetical protein
MNSLPLISHRLFVAAAGHGESLRPTETTIGNNPPGAVPTANVVLLELLDPAQPLPARPVRRLRVATGGLTR